MNYREIAKANYVKVCVRCGATEDLHVHHRNGNHSDNRPENLEYVCRDCHEEEHRKKIRSFSSSNHGNSWRKSLEWNRRR